MKRLPLILLMFFFAFASNCGAKTVSLSWDPSPSDGVVGYKIYYSENSNTPPLAGSGAYEGDSPIDVGNVLSFQVSDLEDLAKHYFAVTAYDNQGNESVYSNMVASNEVVPDLDASWDSSFNTFLNVNNFAEVEINTIEESYIKKYVGPMTKGEVSCFSLDAYYSGNYRAMLEFYAKDYSSGEIVSSQSAVFVDDQYGHYEACVVYQRSLDDAEVYMGYGQKTGLYQFQKMAVQNYLPENPPVENFWLRNMEEPSISGSVYDDVWEWTEPTPSPDSYRVIIGKSLAAVVGQDPENLYADFPVQNEGQSTIKLTVTPELEINGYFIALSSVYGENESVPVIKAHLPGNVIGTADDENPVLFRNITVDRNNDTMTAYGFYRTRTYVPIPGGEPATAVERSSRTNYPYIIRYDFSYVRGREYYTLKMEF